MHTNLYHEYKSEQKRYKLFVTLLRYFGFSMLGLYLYLLFSQKGLDTKYFLLNIYAFSCNASVMILFQYYKIPQLFKNLLSKDESLISESYRIIKDSPEEIYRSFLIELYGSNYSEDQMNHSLEEVQALVLSLQTLDWKLIGKIHFTVFFLLSILLLYILYPLESN